MADIEDVRRTCYQWVNSTYSGVYTNSALDIIVPDIGHVYVLLTFELMPTNQIIIEVRATALDDVQLSDELVRHVAWNGAMFKMGTLSLHRDKDGAWLNFSYSLLWEMATQQIINQVVALVGQTADQLALQLQPTHGGTVSNP